ncbi:MAG: STAS domain-containing protein [Planctomycetota bacterium]|jgi:anti-anti-sigma factor
MITQNVAKQFILVTLPDKGRQLIEELKSANQVADCSEGCDVIIDFSNVEMFTSEGINNLIALRSMLHRRGHRLILCTVPHRIKGVFEVSGLVGAFTFVDSQEAAVAAVAQAD